MLDLCKQERSVGVGSRLLQLMASKEELMLNQGLLDKLREEVDSEFASYCPLRKSSTSTIHPV
jgi:hypothetical protein